MRPGDTLASAARASDPAVRLQVARAMTSAQAAAANVAGFGVRAIAEIAGSAIRQMPEAVEKTLSLHPVSGPLYKVLKAQFAPMQSPRATVVEPCPNTVEGKKRRIERRQQLIRQGRAADASPLQQAAAERLARNNEAVELARLSDDCYAQYGQPPSDQPPLGWNRISDAELSQLGVAPQLLKKSKAVLYRTPPDWPGGQKTVLAFRGTVPEDADDLKTNMDQALGKETAQYQAAMDLGQVVAKQFGSDALVTGHSLGGGKAQAAGALGGLKGMMFNSAGLHPDTTKGVLPAVSQFLQYRSPDDPLTAVQNSAALQSAAAGVAGAIGMPLGAGMQIGDFISRQLGMPSLGADAIDLIKKGSSAGVGSVGNLFSQGYLLPPALGQLVEAPALDDAGRAIAAGDLGGQHSVRHLINGIERQKSEDVATLEQ